MFDLKSTHHSKPFGLTSWQWRPGSLIHNARWYNKAGELLGQGSLSSEELPKIAHLLEEGEFFIILNEFDLKDVGSRYGLVDPPKSDAPGADYVAKRASYILAKDAVYMVDPFRNNHGETVTIRQQLATCTVLDPEQRNALLGSTTTST